VSRSNLAGRRTRSAVQSTCTSVERSVLGAVITLTAAPFALQGLVSAAQGVADAEQPVGIAGVPDLPHEHAGQTHGIDVLACWRTASHISGPPVRPMTGFREALKPSCDRCMTGCFAWRANQ
jgi:hypothetical protein